MKRNVYKSILAGAAIVACLGSAPAAQEGAVAKVGDLTYETLASAVAAAEAGATVEVLSNLTEKVTLDKSLFLKPAADVRLEEITVALAGGAVLSVPSPSADIPVITSSTDGFIPGYEYSADGQWKQYTVGPAIFRRVCGAENGTTNFYSTFISAFDAAAADTQGKNVIELMSSITRSAKIQTPTTDKDRQVVLDMKGYALNLGISIISGNLSVTNGTVNLVGGTGFGVLVFEGGKLTLSDLELYTTDSTMPIIVDGKSSLVVEAGSVIKADDFVVPVTLSEGGSVLIRGGKFRGLVRSGTGSDVTYHMPIDWIEDRDYCTEGWTGPDEDGYYVPVWNRYFVQLYIPVVAGLGQPTVAVVDADTHETSRTKPSLMTDFPTEGVDNYWMIVKCGDAVTITYPNPEAGYAPSFGSVEMVIEDDGKWDIEKQGTLTKVIDASELPVAQELAVAKVGEVTYGTLARAVAVAGEGETVEVLSNLTENVTIDKSLFLKPAADVSLADITVTLQDGAVLSVSADAADAPNVMADADGNVSGYEYSSNGQWKQYTLGPAIFRFLTDFNAKESVAATTNYYSTFLSAYDATIAAANPFSIIELMTNVTRSSRIQTLPHDTGRTVNLDLHGYTLTLREALVTERLIVCDGTVEIVDETGLFGVMVVGSDADLRVSGVTVKSTGSTLPIMVSNGGNVAILEGSVVATETGYPITSYGTGTVRIYPETTFRGDLMPTSYIIERDNLTALWSAADDEGYVTPIWIKESMTVTIPYIPGLGEPVVTYTNDDPDYPTQVSAAVSQAPDVDGDGIADWQVTVPEGAELTITYPAPDAGTIPSSATTLVTAADDDNDGTMVVDADVLPKPIKVPLAGLFAPVRITSFAASTDTPNAFDITVASANANKTYYYRTSTNVTDISTQTPVKIDAAVSDAGVLLFTVPRHADEPQRFYQVYVQ